MLRVRTFSLVLVACLALGVIPQSQAADATPAAPPAPRCFALIIGGTPGSPMHARHYADWVSRFHAILKPKVTEPKDLIVLTSQQEIKVRSGDATSEAILLSISNVVARATLQDQFVLVLIGHGQAEGALAVTGPDLSPEALAEALLPLSAKQQIVLGLQSSSGAMIPLLAKPGRILIASNAAGQTSDSEFAEFVLLALEAPTPSSTADGVAVAPKHSLLDIFNTASYEYAQWIARQQRPSEAATPDWLVQGRRSREIFRKLYGEDDAPETKRMSTAGGNEDEDAKMVLVLGATPDVEFWSGRRLPNGTPLLEDTGKSDGISSLGATGYTAITGAQSGGVGMLSKRTVLGVPEGNLK